MDTNLVIISLCAALVLSHLGWACAVLFMHRAHAQITSDIITKYINQASDLTNRILAKDTREYTYLRSLSQPEAILQADTEAEVEEEEILPLDDEEALTAFMQRRQQTHG